MAVRECAVNAVVHGNRYNKNKRVHLEIQRSAQSLTMIIGDEGDRLFDVVVCPIRWRLKIC